MPVGLRGISCKHRTSNFLAAVRRVDWMAPSTLVPPMFQLLSCTGQCVGFKVQTTKRSGGVVVSTLPEEGISGGGALSSMLTAFELAARSERGRRPDRVGFKPALAGAPREAVDIEGLCRVWSPRCTVSAGSVRDQFVLSLARNFSVRHEVGPLPSQLLLRCVEDGGERLKIDPTAWWFSFLACTVGRSAGSAGHEALVEPDAAGAIFRLELALERLIDAFRLSGMVGY